MGAVGSQKAIGADARNLGIRMENDPAKIGPILTMFTPSLAAASGDVPETSSGLKNRFSEHKMYTDQERYDCDVGNARNFRKLRGLIRKCL